MDLKLMRASEIHVPVATQNATSCPLPALTGDFNPDIEQQAGSSPPAEAGPALTSVNEPIPTEVTDPIPTTAVDPTPTTKGDTTPATDKDPTMRPGSVPPTSDSELTQLSDA